MCVARVVDKIKGKYGSIDEILGASSKWGPKKPRVSVEKAE
jgi:hypothetical protein